VKTRYLELVIHPRVVTWPALYERENTSEVCGCGDSLRLRQRDQDPVHEAGDYRGYLQCVPSLLHRPAEFVDTAGRVDKFQQRMVDQILINLDGSPNKMRLGANAILPVSMAAARAAAGSLGVPLFRYLGGTNACILPVPMMNILNGGKHAANSTDLQEFMIMPVGADNFNHAVQMCVEIYQQLKQVLKAKGYNTNVGDEGGFAPPLESNEQAVEAILSAIEKAHYLPGKDCFIALDPASSEFYRDGWYVLEKEGKTLNSQEMVDFYTKWTSRYPILSIEDGMAEDDSF
jgi:enolase